MYRRYFFRDIIYKAKIRSRNKQILFGESGKRRKSKIPIYLGIFLILLSLGFIYLESNIKPTIIAMAEANASSIATYAISESINEEIVNKVKYEDLVVLQKDNQGKVTAVQTNIVKMNEMQALTSKIVQEKIARIDSSQLYIPIGNVFNSSIFAGWGPKIRIKIIPIGNVYTKFSESFTSAGINQTKHRISLEVKSSITVIVPLIRSRAQVSTTIPIAETIIVGDVPQSYLNVISNDPQNEAKNIIENMAGN